MKVLAAGDLHIHARNEFSVPTEGGSTSLIDECLRSMGWVADLVRKEKPDLFVFLGDIYHTMGYAETIVVDAVWRAYESVVTACESVDAEHRWIVGNHDLVDTKGRRIHGFPFFDGVVNCPEYVLIKDRSLLLVPYYDDYEELQEFLVPGGEPRSFDLAFIHADVVGASWYKTVCDVGLDPTETYSGRLFNGHHHTPEELHQVVNVGSLMYHSFKDRWNGMPRGAVLIDGDGSYERYGNPHTTIYDTVEVTEDQLLVPADRYPDSSRVILRLVGYEDVLDAVELNEDDYKAVKYVTEKRPGNSYSEGLDVRAAGPSTIYDAYTEATEVPKGVAKQGKALLDDVSEDVSISLSDVLIERIEAENFFSLSGVGLSITEGLTLIEGMNLDASSADSNGAGKSAIFEALLWCLYGKTSRKMRSDEVVNRHVDGGTRVSTTLATEGERYQVIRHRLHEDHGNALYVKRESDDGVEDISRRTITGTQKVVDQIVGLDHANFSQVSYLTPAALFFLEESDNRKKAKLEELSGIWMFQDCFQQAKGRRKRRRQELSALEQKIEVLEAKRSSTKETLKELREERNEHEAKQEQELAELQEKKKTFEEDLQQYEELLSFLDTAAEKVQKEKSRFHGIVDRLQRSAAELQEFRTAVEMKQQQYRQEYRRVKSLVDQGKCPTCHQSLEDGLYEGVLEELKEAVTLLRKVEKEGYTLHETLEDRKQGLEWTQCQGYELETALRENRSELKACQANVATRKKELEKTIAKMQEHKPYQELIRSALEKMAGLKEKINEKKRQKATMTYRLAEADKLVSLFERIRGFALRAVVDALNVHLQRLTETMSSSELSLWFSVSEEDESFEFLVNESPDRYGSLSSGERRRVDLTVALALNEVLADSRGGTNLLVLDEIDSGLDFSGLSSLVETLEQFQRAVYLVSHNPNLKSLVSDSITVVKEDGMSRVQAA